MAQVGNMCIVGKGWMVSRRGLLSCACCNFFFGVVVIPMLVDRDFVFVCPCPCRRNVATIPEPRARDSVVVIVGPFRPMSGDFKCVVACWVAVSRRA